MFLAMGKFFDSAMYRKYVVRPATTTINSRVNLILEF